MIARLASFMLILWALGFALFAVTLGKPAKATAKPTQAIVVLTGGKYRIEHAAKLLGQGKGERLLIAGLLVALIALATAAAVVLATRSALDTHRGTIDVLHGIGATDLQVTRLFQRKIAIDALIGGIAGAVLAALVLLLVAGGQVDALGDWTNGSLLRGVDLVLLASLPLLAAILATVVARTTVLAALRAQL